MKLSQIIAIVFAVAPQPALMADDEEQPVNWVPTSVNGDFFFQMVPPTRRKEGDKYTVYREPSGVAYKISKEWKSQELWRTQGWYTFKGYLSTDRQYFVRFGPRAIDKKKHSDLALAFYDNGKLIKQYEVRELIKKPDLLEESEYNYMWQPQVQSEPDGFKGKTFHLVMIDKTTYTFNYTTGEILETGIDKEARSMHELLAVAKSAAEKKGKELFEASDLKKNFEEQFRFSNIQAADQWTVGLYFKGPEWTADLKPIKKYSQPCEVEAVFPIKEEKKIYVLIEPQEIDYAFEAALSHPFVAKRFSNNSATGLRLRITGDRLHRDTPELVKFLDKLTGTHPKDEELRQWVYIIIDDMRHQYTSIYLNTKTKELIYEDATKLPYEPILLDSTGKRMDTKKARANPLHAGEPKPE